MPLLVLRLPELEQSLGAKVSGRRAGSNAELHSPFGRRRRACCVQGIAAFTNPDETFSPSWLLRRRAG